MDRVVEGMSSPSSEFDDHSSTIHLCASDPHSPLPKFKKSPNPIDVMADIIRTVFKKPKVKYCDVEELAHTHERVFKKPRYSVSF